jgi:hypothetical protein
VVVVAHYSGCVHDELERSSGADCAFSRRGVVNVVFDVGVCCGGGAVVDPGLKPGWCDDGCGVCRYKHEMLRRVDGCIEIVC